MPYSYVPSSLHCLLHDCFQVQTPNRGRQLHSDEHFTTILRQCNHTPSGSVTTEKCCFSKVKNLFEYQQCQLVASYCCDSVEGRSRNDITNMLQDLVLEMILQLLESSVSMLVRCRSEWWVSCSTEGGIVDVPTSHWCCWAPPLASGCALAAELLYEHSKCFVLLFIHALPLARHDGSTLYCRRRAAAIVTYWISTKLLEEVAVWTLLL